MEAGSLVPPGALPRQVSSTPAVSPREIDVARESRESGEGEEEEFRNEVLVVRTGDGAEVRRLGVTSIVPHLRMLETGEAVYAPATQEGPVLTEDLIRETEELVLRTGSVGAGCSQLFADMQAFKAANPGCILEDFVRWYSPLDWVEDGTADPMIGSPPASFNSPPEAQVVNRWSGALSGRMQTNGNLWRELWASARPIPAVKQAPLFDEELAGESALDWLMDVPPLDLFEQLFTAVLGAGFAIAEAAPQSKVEPLRSCIQECRTYVALACTPAMSAAKLERLCQVYEIMEVSVHTPPEEFSPRKHRVPTYTFNEDIIDTSQDSPRDLSTQFVQVSSPSTSTLATKKGAGEAHAEQREDATGCSERERRLSEGGLIYDGVHIDEVMVGSLTERLTSMTMSTEVRCQSGGIHPSEDVYGSTVMKGGAADVSSTECKEGGGESEQKDVNGFLMVSPGVIPKAGSSPPDGDWTLV
eukprot:TRINITY_DN999_c0_g4_i1.p1 TRINITY_DN999_c0_g4~~TRINITY_DN999_c0_g4_i1.p1  ORF type:complete len:483 (-),score=65.34 TRINITY_DN999_c0_g4_i1:156-1571(-)